MIDQLEQWNKGLVVQHSLIANQTYGHQDSEVALNNSNIWGLLRSKKIYGSGSVFVDVSTSATFHSQSL